MSRESRGPAFWIRELVARLRDDPWGGHLRLRRLAGSRRARIRLDGKAVIVEFVDDDLRIREDEPEVAVDGEGATTSEVVAAILDGRLEASRAVERGLISIRGGPTDVLAMFGMIEVLLDASSRVPALRALSDQFRATVGEEGPAAAAPGTSDRDAELDLLARLDLLPGGAGDP